jgi:hypothetical protein
MNLEREREAEQRRRQRVPLNGWAGRVLDWLRRVLVHGFAGLNYGRSERRMELIETLSLGGKRQLMLVVCDGRRVLVGAGGDSIQSLLALSELSGVAGAAAAGAASGYATIGGEPLADPEVRCC